MIMVPERAGTDRDFFVKGLSDDERFTPTRVALASSQVEWDRLPAGSDRSQKMKGSISKRS
jgi:hypothetical protein